MKTQNGIVWVLAMLLVSCTSGGNKEENAHPSPSGGIAAAGSWIVDFNSEKWDSTIFTRYVGPAPRVVYQRRVKVTAPHESVVDECIGFSFESYEGIDSFARKQMGYKSLRDHLNIEGKRVLYESSMEVLMEWWISESNVGRNGELKVPASHSVTLYRYDPDRCHARGIEPCVFTITYTIDDSAVNESQLAVWIDRLRSAKLR